MPIVLWNLDHRPNQPGWGSILCLALAVCWSGCSPSATPDGSAAWKHLPPPPTAPGLAATRGDASAAWVETALSPALLLHSSAKEIRLFVPESSSPVVVPPRYAAIGANGPKVITNGVPVDVSKMQERWILVWSGETNRGERLDCPLGIFLQQPLAGLSLDTNGLALRFREPAGDITLMALYGSRGLPRSAEQMAGLRLSREEIKKLPKIWEWSAAVPRDPLTRLRYWSSALTRFPYAAWGWWEGGQGQDAAATFYAAFAYHGIPFSWNVPPLILAPISTDLGLRSRNERARFEVSRRVFDMDWPRLGQPLFTVPDGERYSVRILPSASKAGAPGATRPEELFHLGPALAVGGSVQPGAPAWQEWNFEPDLLVEAKRQVLRFDPTTACLEWATTNQTGLVRHSLGGIRLEDGSPAEWRVVPLNGNTRVILSSPTR